MRRLEACRRHAGTHHVIGVQGPDVCGHLLGPGVYNAAGLDARVDLIVAGGRGLIGQLQSKDGRILGPCDARDAVLARQQRLDVPLISLRESQPALCCLLAKRLSCAWLKLHLVP